MFDSDGWHKRALRDMVVGIIFGEASEVNFGYGATIEVLERLGGEGGGDLDGTIGAKIVIDHGVAGLDAADGMTLRIHDDKGGEILVLDFGLELAKFANGFFGGSELVRGTAMHHGIPAELDHGPVVAVAISGHNHAAAAGGDAIVGVGKTAEELLEAADVFRFGVRSNVATIKNTVNANALNSLLVGASDHLLEIFDVTVDAAIGKNAAEMEGGRGMLLAVFDEIAPSAGFPNGAALEGGLDLSDALGDNLAGAESVVPNFRITHLPWHDTDGFAGSRQRKIGVVRESVIQEFGVGLADGVAAAQGAKANAVHNR